MGRRKKKKTILTEVKWRQDPGGYRKGFALRLFYLIVGPAKLKRLPRVLRRLGAEIPPGWTPADPWPPGDYIPPGIVFPPDWTPEEPLPPGVAIPPDTIFPPDWTPEEALPPGVVVSPDTVFPPDWTPAEPLPPGAVIPPDTVFPPDWTPEKPSPPGIIIPPGYGHIAPPDNPTPPTYMAPWEPGPARKPPPSPPKGWKRYFNNNYWDPEPFNGIIEWTGTRWHGRDNQPQEQTIRAKGTWTDDYRPKQCKITLTCPAEVYIALQILDTGEHGIGGIDYGENYIDAIIDLEFAAKDIGSIKVWTSMWGYDWYIDNLEWK